MYVIRARNVQQALPEALLALRAHGIRESSRVGDVLRFPSPVTTVLEKPMERVIFHAWRDANPFFHIVEAAWMLAGRDTLSDLTPYVKNMENFSDDGGVTQPGAYGKRWREHEGPRFVDQQIWPDQLNWTVKRLRENPNDRRVVVQMWDPGVDIEAADNNGKDVPCNLTMIPWAMGGKLHLTVFNRSNDIIWGLYGANAVHFSMCLEYLAGRVGLAVGTMTTVSNNFHAYVDKIPPMAVVESSLFHAGDPYSNAPDLVAPTSLFADWGFKVMDDAYERVMREDLDQFFNHGPMATMSDARWPWLRRALAPMALAHQRHKGPRLGRRAGTLSILSSVEASDWRRAATEWAERRYRVPHGG